MSITFSIGQLKYDLYDEEGNRKYLTVEERQCYFDNVERALPKTTDREKRVFALLLYYTGCRISEGLTTTHKHIDFSAGGVIFKTLKRCKTVHQFVTLPLHFLTKIDDVHRTKYFLKARWYD